MAKARGRVRAPELRGAGGWVNTGGRELSLAALRGRFVLLDFWTSACANCLHVLDELRPLEGRDDLVVLGVHSPKFPHEAERAAVEAAVERYGVRHPVLSDPDLHTWRQYAVNAWPTLVLVDPEGYVVARAAGEGHAADLAALAAELGGDHGAVAPADPAAGRVAGSDAAGLTGLRYPAGIARRAGGTFLVADTGHHSVVELAADGETVLRRFGSGERGRADGDPEAASFAEPQGVTVLPDGTAVVADTGNHLLRTVRPDTGAVGTLVDLADALVGTATVPGPVPRVPSPWAVASWGGRLVVAAAGVHLLLGTGGGGVDLLAGTTVEGLRDGPALDGWLAQPSGLAADGDRLWFVDAETSSLRWLRGGVLGTAVGEGLFDFGLVDGAAEQARFQHPLGVTLLPDRTVAVLDTYNGAVRRYDPRTGTVTTLATGLAEPAGAVVDGTDLVVVESAAHRLTRLPLPPTEVGTGPVTVAVAYAPRPGRKIDDRWGPAASLTITADPPDLLATPDAPGPAVSLSPVSPPGPAASPDPVAPPGSAAPTGPAASAGPVEAGQASDDGGDALTSRLRLVGTGRLRVTARAASCDDDACYLATRTWDLTVTAGGPDRVDLLLDDQP
ncbi:MAG: NHL repeat containing protein [uncultured Corynebacteriales bacterium]|uniref:NHL repeat containing protein n=1 Tax=uncultured Mycobacteriales bacterium TaxID=581187 RepID=A0A6J4H7A3_9ACTN|nr:MAG: NHL repeat containing protein [uncultured Corynebacteriales bacterium]